LPRRRSRLPNEMPPSARKPTSLNARTAAPVINLVAAARQTSLLLVLSLVQALRFGSGRGPTLRTASRGARSGWVKRATGFTKQARPPIQVCADSKRLQAPFFLRVTRSRCGIFRGRNLGGNNRLGRLQSDVETVYPHYQHEGADWPRAPIRLRCSEIRQQPRQNRIAPLPNSLQTSRRPTGGETRLRPQSV
jgi:hypothetical protein